MPRKTRYYICVDCNEQKATKATSSYICRSCLCKRNSKKGNQAAVLKNTLRPYEAVYRSLLRTAVHKVEISFEDFLLFTEIDNCYYCNNKITWHKKSVSKNKHGMYMRYNLDRKDSSKNYTKDNCVVCCPKCNKAKMDNFNDEEFIQIVKLIRNIRGEW